MFDIESLLIDSHMRVKLYTRTIQTRTLQRQLYIKDYVFPDVSVRWTRNTVMFITRTTFDSRKVSKKEIYLVLKTLLDFENKLTTVHHSCWQAALNRLSQFCDGWVPHI